MSEVASNIMGGSPTYSHIAKPEDSRCRWWQRIASDERSARLIVIKGL